MRTVKGLFTQLCDPAHLERAMRTTTRGKRRRADVAWYLFHAEARLAELREALQHGTWRPSPLTVHRLRDPKPRAIAIALIEDRVAHAALALLLEEAFGPTLMPENYACRRGFGAHRARLALQRGMRAHRFAIHLDIRAYFPSIELTSLRRALRRRIRDERFLGVLDLVLDVGAGLIDRPGLREFLGLDDTWPPRGRGLPVGAYTSQIMATHVVLGALDHFVKRELKVPAYARFVDDIFLFGDRDRDLRRWREAIARWLQEERDLRLKHPTAPIVSTSQALSGLGAVVTRTEIRPDRGARRRLVARIRRRLAIERRQNRRHAEFVRTIQSSVSA